MLVKGYGRFLLTSTLPRPGRFKNLTSRAKAAPAENAPPNPRAMPKKRTQFPRPNRSRSQMAPNKQRTKGQTMENPNWVNQTSSRTVRIPAPPSPCIFFQETLIILPCPLGKNKGQECKFGRELQFGISGRIFPGYVVNAGKNLPAKKRSGPLPWGRRRIQLKHRNQQEPLWRRALLRQVVCTANGFHR